jgi:hypothetical protein
VSVQLFIRDRGAMIAAAVQRDVDRVSKRSHHAKVRC